VCLTGNSFSGESGYISPHLGRWNQPFGCPTHGAKPEY
jgi:hypothetical protein